MTSIAIFAGLSWLIYQVGKRLFGEKDQDYQFGRNSTIMMTACILALALIFLKGRIGQKIPGSWLERSEYTASIFVNAQRGNSTPVHVPATIIAGYHSESYENQSNWGPDETTETTQIYHIKDMRIGSRKIVFEPLEQESLRLGGKVQVRDTQDTEWNIELTNQPNSE